MADRERIDSQIQALLTALTPTQAQAMRARFGIVETGGPEAADERTLRALARELATLNKKKR